MADITSTLSEFDEWLKRRRQAQVAGMGTIESGDYGAKPYYTETGGLGEAGPAMNPQQYSRLGNIMNPPTPETPALPEYTGVPGPGTAAREEGVESIRLAAQGVPKVSALETATNQSAPEEFSRPDVWSGQRFVSGAGAKNEEEYNKRWQMASALEGAEKPYFEKTKEGYKLVFQPESVLKGKLETFSGATEAGVQKDIAGASALLSEGKYREAAAVLAGVEARLKPQEVESKTKLEAAQTASEFANVGYKGDLGEQARATAGYMSRRGTEESKLEKADQELQKKKAALLMQKAKDIDSAIKTWGAPENKPGVLGTRFLAGPNESQRQIDVIEKKFDRDLSMLETFGGGFAPPGLAIETPSLYEQYRTKR